MSCFLNRWRELFRINFETSSSEGLVTLSSGAGPYEAMERDLARPAVNRKKLGVCKGGQRVDGVRNMF
jgi:hypothetical protein